MDRSPAAPTASAAPDGAPARARWVSPAALTTGQAGVAANWDALADAASEPNPFLERWSLIPSLIHFPDPQCRVAVAEDADGALVGLVPITQEARYGRLPLRHSQNWAHPNMFHGAPLVRAGQEDSFWRALLTLLDADGGNGPLLHLRDLTDGGPLLEALHRVVASRGGQVATVMRHERALLQSDLSPDAYWTAAMRGKKRKELRRQMARLAETGAVRFVDWRAGDDVRPWMDAFLSLEAQGWKGAAGSALAVADDTRAWFTALIPAAAEAGRLDMRAMHWDDRPIAMLISFLSPPGGFSFKTAFDESLSRFSPGVQLQQHALTLLNDNRIDWVDSCAAPNHPMIDSIWQERRGIVRVSVPLGGSVRRGLFAGVIAAEAAWGRLRGRDTARTQDTQDDRRDGDGDEA